MTRPILSKSLRGDLEKVILKARDIAERAAREELIRLGINSPKVPEYLDEAEKAARRDLRAHGRQLGDQRQADGSQDIDILTEEVAYEHWHRMLFARFLIENGLLIHPEHGIGVSMEELEYEAGKSAESPWQLAGTWACAMLPQIFRTDHPAFKLRLSDIAGRELEGLLAFLGREVFTSSDSLGWVYQFWQSKRKDEVNASEVKIGARELPAVTQLFTEPYMVSFLLDNALGAWWAGKRLSETDFRTATTEEELRTKASLPGVPLEYLRFVKTESGSWEPAAGIFESWPPNIAGFKILDPCCGSGHFLVALFEMLVPLRMEAEGLNAREATKLVLTQNLHALELDKRCVELAVFNLALAVWLFPGSGGYRGLPELNIACSGLGISAARQEWEDRFALKGKNQRIALDWLYDTFSDAPILGSLINPDRRHASILPSWKELSSLFSDAINSSETDMLEAGVIAQGLAKASELLSSQYTWVVTNVPYLGRKDHCSTLAEFCKDHFDESKNDLATVFLERCLEFCTSGGSASLVLPQNWLFLTSYRMLREKLLSREVWHLIGRLGARAFETITGEVVKAVLLTISHGTYDALPGMFKKQFAQKIRGIDVSNQLDPTEKANVLREGEIISAFQSEQLENPDARVIIGPQSNEMLLSAFTSCSQGLTSGDNPMFFQYHWEQCEHGTYWRYAASSSSEKGHFGGANLVLRWENGRGLLVNILGEGIKGRPIWGKHGVSIGQMSNLPALIYFGSAFDMSCATVIPIDPDHLSAVWCYCSSSDYNCEVRKIDQKLNVTNATLIKVPFDIEYWVNVAEDLYPHGLPRPYSNDPTQWLFHGHPSGSVIWDVNVKNTADAGYRIDNTVFHIAVARLLGFRWPTEIDPSLDLAPQQRAWVDKCGELLPLADDDGIVCIPPVRGERPAVERLRAMLRRSYGGNYDEDALLAAVDSAGSSLETWLRDRFFEQHCKLFLHRPFVWQIWDGDPRGFSALVNYHKLDFSTLEKLTHTYLGDWITQQQAEVKQGLPGADTRLLRARALQDKLKLILKGEKPYDIFVRWKSLAEQPVGWNPDLNDGVRLNIRPFVTAEVLRCFKKPKLNIEWGKDRGKDVASAPWFHQFKGERINDWHTSLEEKERANGKN